MKFRFIQQEQRWYSVDALCRANRSMSGNDDLRPQARDLTQDLAQPVRIPAAQIGVVPDEEQVTHKDDPILRQEEHGIALGVTAGKGYQLG